MVGAPGSGVVEQDLLGEAAKTGFPRGAIAASVADDQVGRESGRVAGIDFIGAVDLANDGFAVEVMNCLQSCDELLRQLLPFFTRLDDAVALASLEVEIQPVDAHAVRARTRPVGVGEDVRALARIEVTVIAEPT